jgi:nucleotide-binding universal stress UspA family protein
MGTHGRTGFDRLFVGSVTERVVRTSDVPVLTSRFEPEKSVYDDVLLPTDGSEAASAAIEHGIALAEHYDATIHALSVVDLSALAGSYDGGAAAPGVIETLEESSEQTFDEVAEQCERHDVDARTEVTQGTPYQAINAYVEEEVGCDYDTARRRLRRLAERGEVDRRQVSSLTLWTVSDGGRSERDRGEEASA